MKFRTVPFLFWRVRGDCCQFIEILNVLSDDGETAELEVNWCRQSDKGWKRFANQNVKIRMRDYPTWVSYFPRGVDLDAS